MIRKITLTILTITAFYVMLAMLQFPDRESLATAFHVSRDVDRLRFVVDLSVPRLLIAMIIGLLWAIVMMGLESVTKRHPVPSAADTT